MKNNNLIVVLISLFICIFMVGYTMLFSFTPSSPKKAISCKNDWSNISFLITEDGKNKELIMNGEAVPMGSIKLFNETAISAQWDHGKSKTKFFLDRISGRLEVETKEGSSSWDKVIFECSHTPIRF